MCVNDRPSSVIVYLWKMYFKPNPEDSILFLGLTAPVSLLSHILGAKESLSKATFFARI